MRNILITILLLFTLLGCSTDNAEDDIALQVNALAEANVGYDNNNHKEYYNYFTNVEVGKLESNEVSTVLSVNNDVFVMNLKVNKIINDEYYHNDVNEEYDIRELLFENNGIYSAYGLKYNYEYSVYSLNSDDYLLTMDTEYLSFSSIAQLADMADIAREMLNIAKSVQVDRQLVINDFSNKETIDHVKETIKLFEQRIAVNGSLEEMMGIDSGDDEVTTTEDGSDYGIAEIIEE